MEALIVIGYAMLHLTVGGVSYAKIQSHFRPICKYQPDNCDSDCAHSFWAGVSTLIWPIVLPVLLGTLIGGGKAGSRTERRRAKEIAEAEHKVVLAEIAEREHAALDRELARVGARK